ncbi:MAG TPA: DoxX family protein [Myxococcota bacterium]
MESIAAAFQIVDVARALLGLVMFFAGVMHFVVPRGYVKMMPPYLPAHRALVALSGIAEIVLAVLVVIPATRAVAAVGLIALFIAVFPANLHMAVHKIPLGNKPMSPLLLWGRLPLQLVFIAWAWWVR